VFRAFYHIFFLHPFGANLSTESFANNAVLINLSALFDIFNFTDSGLLKKEDDFMSTTFDTAKLTKTIEDLCTKKNISVKEMLLNCGLSRNVVDNLKKGSIPSVDKMAKIASYFGVPIDFLLGTGVFSNWNEIYEHKEAIIETMERCFDGHPQITELLKLLKLNDIFFVAILNTIVSRIEFHDNNDFDIYFFISPENNLNITGDASYINGDNNSGQQAINGNINSSAYSAEQDDKQLLELIKSLDLVERSKIITQIDEMKNKK